MRLRLTPGYALRALIILLAASSMRAICTPEDILLQPRRHTIAFDLQMPNTERLLRKVSVGQTMASSFVPERTGYRFEGWYVSPYSSTRFDFGKVTSAYTIAYARWRTMAGEARLLSFSFEQAHNTFSTLHQDERTIEGVIDEAAHSVTVTPSAYLYAWTTNDLRASFSVSAGAVVRVGGKEQTSGQTPNSFASPVRYEIVSADGKTTQIYTVTTLPQSRLATIPDPIFLQYLQGNFGSALRDNKLYVDDPSVKGFSDLIALGDEGVTSLKGVEFFVSTTGLYCSDNQLTELNTSKNTAISLLACARNQLTALDVRQNVGLALFNCAGNQLKTLDVRANVALTDLYCSANQLSALDISRNTALTTLDCSVNQLSALDMGRNMALVKLYCSYNQLTVLDVGYNTALTELYCEDNQLAALDVSRQPALATLLCRNNRLKTLSDVGKNTILTELRCDNNQLSGSIAVSATLATLTCSGNQLTTLNASQNTALKELRCSGNRLRVLDVHQSRELQWLDCSANQLAAFDASQNTNLQELRCQDNPMAKLDMRGMRYVIEGLWINPMNTAVLLVHDNLKIHSQIKQLKQARGAALTISTYSASDGSTQYKLTCADFDPNQGPSGICLN